MLLVELVRFVVMGIVSEVICCCSQLDNSNPSGGLTVIVVVGMVFKVRPWKSPILAPNVMNSVSDGVL